MKLYTELDIRKMLSKRFDLSANELVNLLTPIELPSDEEIDDELPNHLDRGYVNGFYDGAKWVIEQIKQQDNGNT